MSLVLGLGLESVCPRKGCPWPWPRIFFVSLASSPVSSTPPLFNTLDTSIFITQDWSEKSLPGYNIHDYKTWGSPKPLLPVQLDHGYKPGIPKQKRDAKLRFTPCDFVQTVGLLPKQHFYELLACDI